MGLLTFEELRVIQEEFQKADVNKDNVLSLQEFQNLMGSSTSSTIDLFDLFDKNADGKVSFDELVTALAVLTKGNPEQKLEFLFDYYDKDKDGFLTSNEIRVLINHVKAEVARLLGPGKEHQAELEAESIVSKLDGNKDGRISRAEWVGYGATDANLLHVFGLDNLLKQ